METRQDRGQALAQTESARIKPVDGALWFVPSDRAGGYLVNVETGVCSCPDSAAVRCKHLIAVELVRGGLVKPDAPKPPPRGDLTKEEQARVRAALRFARVRAGGWEALAKALRCSHKTLQKVGHRSLVTASVAVRLARFAGVPVDDVLSGRYPPEGACPHCGRT